MAHKTIALTTELRERVFCLLADGRLHGELFPPILTGAFHIPYLESVKCSAEAYECTALWRKRLDADQQLPGSMGYVQWLVSW